jgi:outer membrane autotransporter protein
MWGDGFGLWGNQDGVDGFTGYEYRTSGGVLGVDSIVSDRFLAGIGLGQSRTNVDLDNNRGNGDIDSTFGSLYGSYFTPNMYIDVALSYGSQSYESNRNVVIDNVAGALHSGHDADVYSAYAEGGYNLYLEKWVLQPYAHLQYMSLDEQGYTETGMEGVSLKVQGRKTESLVSELGARFERVIPTSSGILLPGVSAAWSHDFGIDDRTITSSFTAAPGTSFSVQGQEMESDGAVLGVGVTYLGKTGVSASIKYSGEFREDYTAQGIYGEFRYEF